MEDENKTTPRCPACHIGCRIDRYQCGRGADLHERWLNGEEIPQRGKHGRPGGPDGPKRGFKKPPAAQRIEFILAILPHVMQMHAHEGEPEKLLLALGRREGQAALPIMANELNANAAGLQAGADELARRGWAEFIKPHEGGTLLALTENGREALADVELTHRRCNDEFISVLGNDEVEQLATLLEELLHRHPHPEQEKHRE